VPSGGELRRVGQPALNDDGLVAFRASFVDGSGGTGGLYRLEPDGIRPFVLQRDGSPLGGRFASFGPRLSMSAAGEVAFSAAVSRGRASSGLFVACPTRLAPGQVKLRTGRRLDRVRVAGELELGRLNDGVAATREALTVWVNDARGTIWSATVPARRLRKAGSRFTVRAGRGTSLGAQIASARVAVLRNGHVRVQAISPPLPLTRRGTRPLTPPFTAGIALGNDAGTATFDCPVTPTRTRCTF
jgi:hypothetical protein